MIYEVKMYAAKCDGCGYKWGKDGDGTVAYTDISSMEEQIYNDDWLDHDGKHYCPRCHKLDDKGESDIFGANINVTT